MIKVNEINTKNKTLVRNRVFKTEQEALEYMAEDRNNRVFRDMGEGAPMRYQVQVFVRNSKKESKAAQVRELVNTMIHDKQPKDIISTIMEQFNMKKNAAATYFYNAKRQLGLN